MQKSLEICPFWPIKKIMNLAYYRYLFDKPKLKSITDMRQATKLKAAELFPSLRSADIIYL
jgi:hypothetical protein